MNKLQELEKKYKELGEEIERLKNQAEAWKPNMGEKYHYIFGSGEPCEISWGNCCNDEGRHQMGNCFKTKEEAVAVAEKIKIYTQLKRLAEEINTEPIDWGNYDQEKYSLFYIVDEERLNDDNASYTKTMDGIFSTNPDFLDIAKERIGEENLLKLFKE